MAHSHTDFDQSFDEVNTLLIARMASRRRELSITQEEIAEAIGISEEEYSFYENGVEPMPASVVFLASIILDGDPLAFINEVEDNKVAHAPKAVSVV